MGRSVRWMIWVVLTAALVASACGSETTETVDGGSSPVTSAAPATTEAPSSAQAVEVSGRSDATADPMVAGEAITAFGTELFGAARSEAANENVTLSPMSIAIALAMVEPGAIGDAQTQLRDVLHIEDPVTFHASMNALEQDLENRVPSGNDEGDLTLRIANAAYLQQGYPFEAAYLDTIGSNYGPALNEVDFAADPDAVAHEINDWVADQTEQLITDLIADGALTSDTVFALVNALYMNASWREPFNESRTVDRPFTLLEGTEIDVPLMSGRSDWSSSGDGWVGATKVYVGGLYVQFILPDEGRFDEIADNLATVIEDFPSQAASGAALVVPKFESRTRLELTPPLNALGLTAPYAGGNLLGIANDPSLVVDKVIHETFIAFDEERTEAAAATAVVAGSVSAPAFDPVPVILDRPFLYRIMDSDTGTTLFIGQILNPTA